MSYTSHITKNIPRPSIEYWMEKAIHKYGNLPPHELKQAAEYLMQQSINGISSYLS